MKHLKFIILVFIFSSCASQDFKVLETTSQSGITVELRSWIPFLSSTGPFEIRLTNNSNSNYKNCEIIFDGKFIHKLDGLHTRETGMIKDSVFHKGSQVTIYFSDDDSNLIFFEGAEEGYIPEVIGIKCDECDGEWKIK